MKGQILAFLPLAFILSLGQGNACERWRAFTHLGRYGRVISGSNRIFGPP